MSQEVEADIAWEGDGRTNRAVVDCDRMKVMAELTELLLIVTG